MPKKTPSKSASSTPKKPSDAGGNTALESPDSPAPLQESLIYMTGPDKPIVVQQQIPDSLNSVARLPINDPGGEGGGGGGDRTPEIQLVDIKLGNDYEFTEPRLGKPATFKVNVATHLIALKDIDLQITSEIDGKEVVNDSFIARFVGETSSTGPVSFTTGTWTVTAKFGQSGDRLLVATATVPTSIEGIEPFRAERSIKIAPTNRQPMPLVYIDGTRAKVSKPKLRLPLGVPTKFKVEAYPDDVATTQSVTVTLRFDGVDLQPVSLGRVDRPNGVTLWSSQEAIILSEDMAPRPFALKNKPEPLVLIRDTDFFGATYDNPPIPIEIIDFTPPVLDIKEPEEDHIYTVAEISDAKPLTVKVWGTIKDVQSGYKDNSLQYSFGSTPDVPVNVVNGEFSFDLKIRSYAQHQFSMTAEDQVAPEPNRLKTVVRQFSVVPKYKPKSIDDLLSPRAYFEELLRFTTNHVLSKPVTGNEAPSFLTSDMLKNQFKQDFGLLAQLGVKDAELPVSNLLIPMRILRSLAADELANMKELGNSDLDPATVLSEAAAATYHEAAYEALLHGLGTSFEELRSLRTMSEKQRHDLAARLDLLTDQGDFLDEISLPPGGPVVGTAAFERWLEEQFGLPQTQPSPVAVSAIPRVLQRRQMLLAGRWLQADKARRVPDLDPDLVELADLAPTAKAWRDILEQRSAALANLFEQLRSVEFAREMADLVGWGAEQIDRLLGLAVDDAAGKDITSDLESLGPLRLAEFRRLVAYFNMNGAQPIELSLQERDDLANLLVQTWKPSFVYPKWLDEEAHITDGRLWPTADAAAAWSPGNYRRVFQTWRGDVESRVSLEHRLGQRLSQWQALLDEHQRAVIMAQQQTLPILRRALLSKDSIPPTAKLLDGLSKHLLVDFAVNGASLATPLSHATASLQRLIDGIARKRFAVRHPAHDWSFLLAYQAGFATEWGWLGTYATWRSAVLNYLYPENVLYPELLESPSDGNPNKHKAFFEFLAELTKLMPLNARSFEKPPEGYTTKLNAVVDSNEKDFVVPVAIGLAFQRSRQHALALDQYRKVYDWTKPAGSREQVAWLITERPNLPPKPNFTEQDQWTLRLSNPHEIARPAYKIRWGNPYTKFVVFQILECLLTIADQRFAAGTSDARAIALALYLEADDILGFEEMQDKKPVDEYQVGLPNPVLAARRAHVASALRKMRTGMSYLGMPQPAESTLAPNVENVAGQVRPTPYRFKTLMERAKQLTALAQQFESQYLSAIERNEIELEKILERVSALDIADKTVELRKKGKVEAKNAKTLAETQGSRSKIQQERYSGWIAAGPSANEIKQIASIKAALNFRNIVTALDAASAAAQATASAAGIAEIIGSAGAKQVIAVGLVAIAAGKGLAQGALNGWETGAQLSAIDAAQERRAQEWQLQADLATADVAISADQITLAQNRIDIADQEYLIADAQQTHANQMLDFLRTGKFTNASFYEWLAGVLADTYAFFLRIAATTGMQAELQLAFERQEQPMGLLRSDYWRLASSSPSGSNSGTDRRGITGSARLAQDLYTLDQRAFDTDRRAFNLTQAFSLSRLIPVEFEEFRRTGSLSFATPMSWFDEGFPGHHMRLIKRVRVSVAALIPPSQGIRASLTNTGLTRVVTSDPGFPVVVIRQDPEMVALTSPSSSTGVFELDTQSELLFPFEGSGVDGTWFFELPRAGNPIDFDSLVDVIISIDYTARFSGELRERVIKTFPATASGVRSFSVKQDIPDTWYEISNSAAPTATIVIPLKLTSFPVGLRDIKVYEVSVTTMMVDGSVCEFESDLSITFADKATRKGASLPSFGGIVSSRRTNGAAWHREGINLVLDDLPPLSPIEVKWTFDLSNSKLAGSTSIIENLRTGKVADILVNFSFEGQRPAWV